jgi:hypothetical protein
MKMIWRAAVLVALVTTCVAEAGDVPPLDPSNGIVFSGANVRALLNQCSRAAPKHVQGTWQPTADQIRSLEALLPAALAVANATWMSRDPNATSQSAEFGRQYSGLILDGRKIIYMNAFPLDKTDFDGTKLIPFDWHAKPAVVCDGGNHYFGVEYAPESKTFSHFAFNGAI